MGKSKKKKDSDSDEDEKKKKIAVKKKKKEKKKKDKKKKKEKKKKESSSSSSSSGSGSGTGDGSPKKAKKQKTEQVGELIPIVEAPKHDLNLAPPEEGILRFEFTTEEAGPLGVRFGSGFPPLILSVGKDSFAGKKGVPPCHEVHAINGLALIPQNTAAVMPCLKARPVTLDVRPQGWKPPERVKAMAKIQAAQEAEMEARKQAEMQRRSQVAAETKEQKEKDAAELAERQAKEAEERNVAIGHARKHRDQQRAKAEDFRKLIEADPLEFRNAAHALMEAEYGSSIQNVKAVPLRLFTRRKEVAWQWDSEVMELIGGGINSDDDSWDA